MSPKDKIQPSLDLFTETELQEELHCREEARRKDAAEKRKLYNNLVFKHKDTLLSLVSHARKSCDAANQNNACFHPDHGVAYCVRCVLEAWEYPNQLDDVDIIVTVQMTKVRDSSNVGPKKG